VIGQRTTALVLIGQLMRSAFARRTPLAYGWLMKRPDDALTEAWVKPSRTNPAIRRQVAGILAGMDRRHTLEAASHFGELRKPVLIAWAPEDKFFKLADAERLARDLPDARLERIDDSYTFVSIDQPARTAELIASFAREPVAATS
jgi:pimeloyl-ACP methyl ester carboxylesterase